MRVVEDSVDVAVPVRAAYERWADFRSYPLFMAAITSVTREGDRLHWTIASPGSSREWDTEIVAEEPDRRIAWRWLDGSRSAATLLFAAVDGGTRVTMQVVYDPVEFGQKAAELMGIVERQTRDNLRAFKALVEGRGATS